MRSFIVAGLASVVLVTGCSVLKGTDTTTVTNYAARAVALGTCVAGAAKDPSPELASATCVAVLVPELPAKYSYLASDIAACVRNAVVVASNAKPEDYKATLATGTATCAAQYVGQIIVAVQDAKK